MGDVGNTNPLDDARRATVLPGHGSSRATGAPVSVECSVAVIGAGVGGLAASIQLRRAGLRVVCIEPEPFPHDRLGESLDWSSPKLLARLGVSKESLIRDRVATYKRNIQIVSNGHPAFFGQPEEWFRRWPLRFEVVTLHVDRVAMDQRLFDVAEEVGVEFLWDRVVDIELDGDRVSSLKLAGGQEVNASWFIDASGRTTRLFARKFKIHKVDYGRTKVCLWTYFTTPPHNEGTTLYGDSYVDEYLAWIWEIPISPEVTSVGCTLTAEFVKQQRQKGKQVHEIMRDQLAGFSRFVDLMDRQPSFDVRSTSYRSYVYDNACGRNWLIVGEAASLPDPLTANGVTAALRHAYEGSTLILESLERAQFTARQRWIYNTNLSRMGHVFNHSIETSVYEWPIRLGLGVVPAQKVYTAFSYTINALYARLMPRGWISMLLFGLLLKGVWAWMETWSILGRVACRTRSYHEPRQLRSGRA